MPSKKELYQRIEELVIEDNLKEALMKLKEEFETLGRFELIDTTIVLLNRLSSFNLRLLQGVEVPAVAEKNKLVLGVLNLLNELKSLHKSLTTLEGNRIVQEKELKSNESGGGSIVEKKTKILFSSANPKGTAKLEIKKEALVIQYEIDNSELRQGFESSFLFNTTPDLLVGSLLKFKPTIFHFAGHSVDDYEEYLQEKIGVLGSPLQDAQKKMGMVFEDSAGEMKVIKGEDFVSLIAVQSENIDCVILNTQYSKDTAESISEIIEYAIGVDGLILDLSAYYFTKGFYMGIANNEDVPGAFEVGKSMVSFNTGSVESEKYFLFPLDANP